MVYNGRIFNLVKEGDNTLKQFMDRFYVLPKDHNWSKEEREFLEKHYLELTEENERLGKDGYIVQRKKKMGTECAEICTYCSYIVQRKKKMFNKEEVEIIKNDTGSYRSLAEKYNISIGTIYKIKNNKY